MLGLLLLAGSTSSASAQWHWRVLLADSSTPTADARKDAAPAPEASELRGNQTEKKTIAQMIDEALEQEFPEEKEDKIGKNYNETAKSSDVRACFSNAWDTCTEAVLTSFSCFGEGSEPPCLPLPSVMCRCHVGLHA